MNCKKSRNFSDQHTAAHRIEWMELWKILIDDVFLLDWESNDDEKDFSDFRFIFVFIFFFYFLAVRGRENDSVCCQKVNEPPRSFSWFVKQRLHLISVRKVSKGSKYSILIIFHLSKKENWDFECAQLKCW